MAQAESMPKLVQVKVAPCAWVSGRGTGDNGTADQYVCRGNLLTLREDGGGGTETEGAWLQGRRIVRPDERDVDVATASRGPVGGSYLRALGIQGKRLRAVEGELK